MSLILVTNVTQYAGPGTCDVLTAQGHRILAHDPSFADPAARAHFRQRCPGSTPLQPTEVDGLYAAVTTAHGLPDAIVSNDVYPITVNTIETVPLQDWQATFDAVVMAPIRLTQSFLPAMKSRRRGSFVFVTSARETRPEPGFSVPTTMRAATTAFVKALSKEAAPFGIQANVVAPNYLYSEMYYPRARFVDDPAGSASIAATVPMGRLGDPKEVGELIAFLASGRSAFTTGQVVYFTGGWP